MGNRRFILFACSRPPITLNKTLIQAAFVRLTQQTQGCYTGRRSFLRGFQQKAAAALQQAAACRGVSQGDESLSTPASPAERAVFRENSRDFGKWLQIGPRSVAFPPAAIAARKALPASDLIGRGSQGIAELAVMANVLNPETESITLNTELESPILEPATEQEQPSFESTSNPETADVVDLNALDADALTEPVAETAVVAEATVAPSPTAEAATEVSAQPELQAEPAPVAEASVESTPVPEVAGEVPVEPQPVAEAVVVAEEPVAEAPVAEAPVAEAPVAEASAEVTPVAEVATETEPAQESAPVAAAPVVKAKATPPEHGLESMDDFSAALAAFEREQAAEAAAVEAYGDKIVSATVIKQTEKHLVVDVGLKSEGLVPIEQVLDHTGAVKFQPGDVIDVVIEREEPEGGYLVSF